MQYYSVHADTDLPELHKVSSSSACNGGMRSFRQMTWVPSSTTRLGCLPHRAHMKPIAQSSGASDIRCSSQAVDAVACDQTHRLGFVRYALVSRVCARTGLVRVT